LKYLQKLSKHKDCKIGYSCRGKTKMKIEILGTGCCDCKLLEAHAKKALDETGKKAELVKVTEIQDIMAYGVMSTPAIVIDGEVKSYGKVADVQEIIKWLK